MALVERLYVFALKQVLPGACREIVGELGGDVINAVSSFLESRLKDPSLRVPKALEAANARAWQALEVALAGESLWGWLDRAEDRALRQQIREFLDALPPGQLPAEGDKFRRNALDELRAARKAGALAGAADIANVSREAARFARYSDPRQIVEAEAVLLGKLGDDLAAQGYPTLGRLVALRPGGGPALLPTAVAYFFRRAVEEDEKLFRGLAWATWDRMAAAQERGFAGLRQALADHGRELEQRLGEVSAHVREVHGVVLDIRAEQQRQGDRDRELYDAVLGLHRRLDRMSGEGVSVRDAAEKQLVRDVLERYRTLPDERRRELPALLHALGELQMRTGQVDDAEQSFARVEAYVSDRATLAESHYHAYRAALGRRDWLKALASYRQAASLDRTSWTRQRLEAELQELGALPPDARDFWRHALAQWQGG